MPTTPESDADVIFFPDAAAFETWLTDHVDHTPGVWLKIAKKSSGIPSLTDDEAVDVGLCFGWISGQRKSLDDVYYLQKYVPRRPRSRWSQVNVRKVEQLTAAGRMRPSGLAEVEAGRGPTDAGMPPMRRRRTPPSPPTSPMHWPRARGRPRPSKPSARPPSTPSFSTWSQRERPKRGRHTSARPLPR